MTATIVNKHKYCVRFVSGFSGEWSQRWKVILSVGYDSSLDSFTSLPEIFRNAREQNKERRLGYHWDDLLGNLGNWKGKVEIRS